MSPEEYGIEDSMGDDCRLRLLRRTGIVDSTFAAHACPVSVLLEEYRNFELLLEMTSKMPSKVSRSFRICAKIREAEVWALRARSFPA